MLIFDILKLICVAAWDCDIDILKLLWQPETAILIPILTYFLRVCATILILIWQPGVCDADILKLGCVRDICGWRTYVLLVWRFFGLLALRS